MFQVVRRYECAPCDGTGFVFYIGGRIVPMSVDQAFDVLAECVQGEHGADALLLALKVRSQDVEVGHAVCPECGGGGEICYRLTFGEPQRDNAQ